MITPAMVARMVSVGDEAGSVAILDNIFSSQRVMTSRGEKATTVNQLTVG
jgi:hypothetical protein